MTGQMTRGVETERKKARHWELKTSRVHRYYLGCQDNTPKRERKSLKEKDKETVRDRKQHIEMKGKSGAKVNKYALTLLGGWAPFCTGTENGGLTRGSDWPAPPLRTDMLGVARGTSTFPGSSWAEPPGGGACTGETDWAGS